MVKINTDVQLRYIAIFIFLSCVGSFLVYTQGLDGPFLLDDYSNLEPLGYGGGIHSLNDALHFIFNNRSGPTGRPVSMASFLLNDQFWPSQPYFFKFTNLAIHIASGLLVFLLFFRIACVVFGETVKSFYIAALTSLLWLFNPLNVSTTLYVVQRMTQLMTFFSLAGLVCYVYGRQIVTNSPLRAYLIMSVGVVIFGALSILSKENGCLILGYIAVIEIIVFSKYERTNIFFGWFGLFIVLPCIVLIGYFVYQWQGIVASYVIRDFTLYERLLTESRILIVYLRNILLPNVADIGIFHDDFVISKGLFFPVTTLISVITLVLAVVVSVIFRKRYKIFAFGVLWFLTGHILESTFLPLELYFDHRNYMPMIGVLFFIAYSIVFWGDKATIRTNKLVILFTFVLLVGYSGTSTYLANLWSNPVKLFTSWSYQYPNSIRAQIHYGATLEQFDMNEVALDTYEEMYRNHNEIGALLRATNLKCLMGTADSSIFVKEIRKPGLRGYKDTLKPVDRFARLVAQGQCQSFDLMHVHLVLDIMTAMPEVQAHGGVSGRLHNLWADLYVTEKNLDEAMNQLAEVFKYEKTVDIRLKQIVLLGSAGLYAEGIEYIDDALEINDRRGFFHRSREGELNDLKKSFKARLNNI